MAQAYHTTPLTSRRSIRVLNLLPALDRSSPLQGTLSEVHLDSDPSFEAVSYVWGGPEPTHVINIILSSPGANPVPLSITPNCWSVLQKLRPRLKRRVLWVDAICIDQTSVAEKNQQVPLMAEIYGRARQVLVWLGTVDKDEKTSKKTFRLFERIGLLYRMGLLRLYEEDEVTKSRMPKESRLVSACEKYVDSKSKKLGDSYIAPFLSSYFQRVWTVQEIAMAHKLVVHCGTSKIPWCDFVASALFTVTREGGFARYQGGQINVFQDISVHGTLLSSLESHFVLPDIYGLEALYGKDNKENKRRNTLEKLTSGTANLALIRSKGLKATEPKDKAYAMLWAFSNPSNALKSTSFHEVDYAKPIDVIFTEYTTTIFVHGSGAPDPFYWINSDRRNRDLPSWVPDWAEDTPMELFLWASKLRSFSAAKEDSGKYKLEIKGRMLRIWGTTHSRISQCFRLHQQIAEGDRGTSTPESLQMALIQVTNVFREIIEAMTHGINDDKEEKLHALHRTIRSQKTPSQPGPVDWAEFTATEKEIELSSERSTGVGQLRIQLLGELAMAMTNTSGDLERAASILEKYLSKAEVQKTVYGVREYLASLSAQIEITQELFAVILFVSEFVDIYRLLYETLVDHRDKDFFITDKGNIGVAFHGLMDGDMVAIWKGCPSPMIVRKLQAESEQDCWRLHGPAYVDGIMEGEGWIQGESEPEKFDLF